MSVPDLCRLEYASIGLPVVQPLVGPYRSVVHNSVGSTDQ